jgi:hypothetical protein
VEKLIDVHGESLNVDGKLITSTVKRIVNDVSRTADTDDFSTQPNLQPGKHVVLSIALVSSEVGRTIVSPESNQLFFNFPLLGGVDEFLLNCCGLLERAQRGRKHFASGGRKDASGASEKFLKLNKFLSSRRQNFLLIQKIPLSGDFQGFLYQFGGRGELTRKGGQFPPIGGEWPAYPY